MKTLSEAQMRKRLRDIAEELELLRNEIEPDYVNELHREKRCLLLHLNWVEPEPLKGL